VLSSEIMDKKKEKQEEEKQASLPARTRMMRMMLTQPAEEATPAAAAAKEAFDPRRCSVTEGYWAYNWTKKLPYTDQTCPFVDRQISCQRNGRPDSDYLYWDWHLDGCTLPRSAQCLVDSAVALFYLFSLKKLFYLGLGGIVATYT